MAVLTTHSTTLDRPILEKKQNSNSSTIAQSMSSRQVCLCCSNPLLRHIRLGKLYWRCHHCYQAMPILEDAQDMQRFLPYEKSFRQQLLILPFSMLEQRCEQEVYERSMPNLTRMPMMIRSS